MSLDAFAWVFNCSPLTGTGLLVHLALADVSDDLRDDELYASQSTIAVRARTTRTTVNKVIADLTERGLLMQVGVLPGGTLRLRLLMPEMPKVGAIKRSERISSAGATAVKRTQKHSGMIPPLPPIPPRPPSVDASNKHTPTCVEQTQRMSHVDTPLCVSSKRTEPFNQLTNQGLTPATDKPSPKGTRGKAPTFTEAADRLARAEWDRREIKPVIPFVAMRTRIDEVLAAGYSEADVERVLPMMAAFSRNAFDHMLGQAKGRRGLRSVPLPISANRDAPEGLVET